MRNFIKLVESGGHRQAAEDALTALMQNPKLATAARDLPSFSQWKPFEEAEAWVSSFHFQGSDGFSLPWHLNDCLYSPTIDVELDHSKEPWAFYKRGINKYTRMLQAGKLLPPITFVYIPREKNWFLQDGSHRLVAYYNMRVPTAKAVLAIDKNIASLV